jgi:hypothetical protein
MAPKRKGRGRRRSVGKSERADDRLLTPEDAVQLAADLGFTEEDPNLLRRRARGVLMHWTSERPSDNVLWFLRDTDARCLAQAIGISGEALEAFPVWLRYEMLAYDQMERKRHEPTVEDVREELPQRAKELRRIEQTLRKYYLAPMIVHELVTLLPQRLRGEDASTAAKAVDEGVKSEFRALSSMAARMELMCKEEMSRRRLFRRAGGARILLSRKRDHDHILAERTLAFWDKWLRDKGVQQDHFCRLVLGLVGIKRGSINTFVRDARPSLRSRTAPEGREALLATHLPDCYGLIDEAFALFLDEEGILNGSAPAKRRPPQQ